MSDTPDLEGSDITAADMVPPPEAASEIVDFFADATVFITGGTGFLGKLFLEKLLRACDVRRIYVLIRPKKGKDVQKRYEEMFDVPSFGPLKRNRPNFTNKITLINGDCALPDLGLDDKDKAKLIAEVNCIIHCAATVRFDEKLRTAVDINVRSTRDLINMAKQMKNLKAMLHVSTAFSFCTRRKIDEVLYDVPMSGNKLIALLDLLDDDTLQKMTPIILGDFPNSYVFTKAVSEDIVKSEGGNLPVAVYRPSIVIASVKEPVAGWIDNLYGATGVLVGAATGVLRSLYGRKEATAELVPADYVINAGLAVLWDVASKRTINDNKESKEPQAVWEDKFEDDVLVYNMVSSPEKKITWVDFTELAERHAKQVPSPLQVWHYFFAMRPNKFAHLMACFFYQTVPAYIVDFIATVIGKKPMMVKGYQKVAKFANVLAYFSCNDWTYTNTNLRNLWKKMNKTDQRLFEFSMKNFNWDLYFYTYVRGARVYLLKDPLDTLPAGQVKYYKLMVAHYTLVTVVFLILARLLFFVFGAIFL